MRRKEPLFLSSTLTESYLIGVHDNDLHKLGSFSVSVMESKNVPARLN